MHARIAVERYGMAPKTVRCPPVNTNLAGSAMTKQQPIFNVIRSTVQALASVLGGVNGMEMKAYTEVMSSSPTAALVINRGIEAIIAEETGVCYTVDPLAGSYYVESLTNQIEDGARCGSWVNAIALSFHTLGHIGWLTEVMGLLRDHGVTERITVFAGGIIPEEDRPILAALGLKGFHGPGTPLATIGADVAREMEG